MATISDLPVDLVGEILARVPRTSLKAVRSSCKKWNALSKSQIIGKAARNQFLGFMLMDSSVFSIEFNDDSDPSIKQISKLKQVKISNIFHCHGLLLCVLKDQSRLLLWNPYLGKAGWIRSRKNLRKSDRYWYALRSDKNNRNHKILSILDYKNVSPEYEIYDFSSNSWRVVDVNPNWYIDVKTSVSLKGNTYFVAFDKLTKEGEKEYFLICFDFTTKRFGPPLCLPIDYVSDSIDLSCVRDEQLALLCLRHYDKFETMEILVSTNIHPNAVSWSKFLKVDMTPLNGFPNGFAYSFNPWSFIVDKEKKTILVSDCTLGEPTKTWFVTVYIIGKDGCFKFVNTEEASYREYTDFKLISYVPSLVQL